MKALIHILIISVLLFILGLFVNHFYPLNETSLQVVVYILSGITLLQLSILPSCNKAPDLPMFQCSLGLFIGCLVVLNIGLVSPFSLCFILLYIVIFLADLYNVIQDENEE